MEKDQVDIMLAKRVPGSNCLFGVIDHAKVHYLGAEGLQAFGYLYVVTLKSLEQALKLGPVGVQSNAEKADTVSGFEGIEWRRDFHLSNDMPCTVGLERIVWLHPTALGLETH